MCSSDLMGGVMSNVGNQNVQRGWKRALFNIVDPGGGLSNTMAVAEYYNKPTKTRDTGYNSEIMKQSSTNPMNLEENQPAKPKQKQAIKKKLPTAMEERQKTLLGGSNDPNNPLQYSPLT